MALGGGTFLVQNKVLPGAYINFISVAQASATLSDRGIVTIPLAMNWGPEGKIFTVEQADFIKNSQKIFGYAYTADELKPMREIFLHAKTVHFFRLGSSGVKASNTYATAKYPGTRGNDLRVVITANENSTEQKPLFDVETFLGTVQVDLQEGVAAITDLKANAYVDWKSSGTLSLTASLPLTGGTNGTVADSDYQTYLDQAEAYTFNAMGCTESKATITALFAAFAKRMRDDVGKKFQVVLFRKLADYEGVVSVKNGLTSDKTSTALIPWVTGVIGGTAVNKSATNMTYDGEYDVDTDFTQTQLENGIREGSFMFHRVDEAVCVLTDINSFISITDEKSSDFSSNQTIRVLDQIANDIAVLFGKKYLARTAAIWATWFFVNFSYYGAFTWMPSLLADQFGSLTKSFGYTLAIAIAQLPGYFLAAWLVEIWGRRKTLSVFLAVSAVAAFAFSQAGSVAAVLGFGMLLSASNLGAWGVLYAVTPEIYPTRLRGAASGAAAACGRVAAIIAPLLMPWFLTLSGGNKAVAFIVFAVAFILACVAALCLPERTGKELED